MVVGVVLNTTDQQESTDGLQDVSSIYIHPSRGHRKKGYYDGKKIIKQLGVISVAITYLTFAPQINPYIEKLAGHATLLSTAIAMPYGMVQSIKERFYGTYIEEENKPLVPPVASSQAPLPESSTAPPSSASSSVAPPIQEPLSPPSDSPPDIPKEFQGPLVAQTMAGVAGNPAFLEKGNVWIRNYTKLSIDEIDTLLNTPADIQVGTNEKPQVLIYHTHTTESYEKYDTTIYDIRNSWRDTEHTNNMTMVGEALVTQLEKEGIHVIHDYEQHDYPAYNGSYERSRKTIEEYLQEYPSIKITIDVHRDGMIGADDLVTKPVVEINGKKAAQLMIIAPCDDGSVGVPNWRENLRFATDIVSAIETDYANLCRPIFFAYRNYNLDLTNGSLLFEVGSNGNTLDEAIYTAQLIAKPLAEVIHSYTLS